MITPSPKLERSTGSLLCKRTQLHPALKPLDIRLKETEHPRYKLRVQSHAMKRLASHVSAVPRLHRLLSGTLCLDKDPRGTHARNTSHELNCRKRFAKKPVQTDLAQSSSPETANEVQRTLLQNLFWNCWRSDMPETCCGKFTIQLQ